MTEEWQGQTLGVHFIEVSALKIVKENDWLSRDKLRCPLKGCVRLKESQ